jgi:hypothetical protein
MSDLISKQEVKKILRTECVKLFPIELDPYLSLALEKIENIPSAEPKNGRWDVEHGVFMNDGIYGDLYRCSVCGYRERNPEGFNYCPNCGAKMEAEE